MSVLAEALSLQLMKKEIKYSVHGDEKEGVMIAQQLPTSKIPVTILFLTDDKTNSVSVRFYNLYKMEDSEITGNLFFLLNQMNERYRWGKVVLDEKDIVISMDAMVTPFNIAEICLQLAYYGAQMADEVYYALEKIKYQL
ncbi:MAG: YbjN domain-containing protein [Lachnospiraceae bacterium]|nr:YbjN domain-containing protein [Lachnospiraceae bacterium]